MYTVFESDSFVQKNIEISNDIIISNLNRIQSQIFKLLPMREEGLD